MRHIGLPVRITCNEKKARTECWEKMNYKIDAKKKKTVYKKMLTPTKGALSTEDMINLLKPFESK